GYLKNDFERKPGEEDDAQKEEPAASEEEKKKRERRRKRREAFQARAAYDRRYNDAALSKLKEMGVAMVPVEMPKFPYDSMITILTGHPSVILPNGIRGDDAPKSPSDEDGGDDNVGGPGTPVSLTFLGGLYGEAKLLAFARAYQEATGFHRQHPKLT